MKRIPFALAALFLIPALAAPASAQRAREAAPTEELRVEEVREAPRGERRMVEDEHTEVRAVTELCAAYDEGSEAQRECGAVFQRMDADADGTIAPEEFNGKYGDILIDGVPLEFD